MDKSEKEALKKQLKSLVEWMRESADVSYQDTTLEDVIDIGDSYEVKLYITLKDRNAGAVVLSNRCTKGYLRGISCCDDVILEEDGIEYNKYGKNYSTGFIPYSNISHIDATSYTDVWLDEDFRRAYNERLTKVEAEAKAKQEPEQPTHPQGEKPHFDYVYCRGTEDGKGVIEALEAHGGTNVYNHDGTNSCYDYTYYIDPDGEIVSFIPDQDADRFILVKQFYTEVQPLTN